MGLFKRNSLTQIKCPGYRQAKRKTLLWKLRLISDITAATAMIGVLLMIFELELVLNGLASPDDPPTFYLRLAISTSTLVLLVFLVWYHVTDVEVHMNDNCVDHWLLAITPGRVLVGCLEFAVCAIHPPPHWVLFFVGVADHIDTRSTGDDDQKATKWRAQNPDDVDRTIPVDVYLSVLMFLRGFLIFRVIVLHSKLCTDASMQSVGTVNRVRFTFPFVFRSLMRVHPFSILVGLIVAVLVTAAWTMRACDSSNLDPLSSLWFVLITFLTVGYGDVVPRSVCGQLVAVVTGFFGIGCMALVVAVLTQKLEMSASERNVHNFVRTIQLENSFRLAAANIIRRAWLAYKARTHGDRLRLYHHRRLMVALNHFRRVKHQRMLASDGNVSLVDVCRGQRTAVVAMTRLEDRMDRLERVAEKSLARLEEISKHLERLDKYLQAKSCDNQNHYIGNGTR